MVYRSHGSNPFLYSTIFAVKFHVQPATCRLGGHLGTLEKAQEVVKWLITLKQFKYMSCREFSATPTAREDFTNTAPDMRIVREEIFRPVGVLVNCEDEKGLLNLLYVVNMLFLYVDIIRVANDTVYGGSRILQRYRPCAQGL